MIFIGLYINVSDLRYIRFIFELSSFEVDYSIICVKVDRLFDDEYILVVFKIVVVNSIGLGGGVLYSVWKLVVYISKIRSLDC